MPKRRSAPSSGWSRRDVQIRLLLGDRFALTKAEIERDAERAAEQFSPSTHQRNRTARKAGDQR